VSGWWVNAREAIAATPTGGIDAAGVSWIIDAEKDGDPVASVWLAESAMLIRGHRPNGTARTPGGHPKG